MLQPINGAPTFARLDVLTSDECAEVADRLLALRGHWTRRNPADTFHTLGSNAYMDLAPVIDSSGYDHRVGETNGLLREHFGAVYAALAAALATALGLVVHYADDLALPGFHVWTAAGIPQRPTASLHFDLQYLPVLKRPGYAGATGTVSFTLPIRLPAAGSSLRVWPQFSYPGAGSARPGADDPPLVIEYTPGCAVVHSGHVLHQIGVTDSVRPDDLRITLQGHGLVLGGDLICYW
jgi:hypothetical protein